MAAAATRGGEDVRGVNGGIFSGSIAQQQRTMIHLAPLPRALIGIRRRIGGSWSVVFGLGIAVRPLVLGMRAIAVHNDLTASYSRAIRISGSHWAVRISLDR